MQMTTFTAKFSFAQVPFNIITGHKVTNRMCNKNSKAFHLLFWPYSFPSSNKIEGVMSGHAPEELPNS